MLDRDFKIEELKQLVAKFVSERGWEKQNTLNNLLDSVIAESHLLKEMLNSELEGKHLQDKLGEGLGSIFGFMLLFSHYSKIDIGTEISKRLNETERNFPLDGNFKKLKDKAY